MHKTRRLYEYKPTRLPAPRWRDGLSPAAPAEANTKVVLRAGWLMAASRFADALSLGGLARNHDNQQRRPRTPS